MRKPGPEDGAGCAWVFCMMGLALVFLGVALGILTTVLLHIWL